MKYYFLVIYQRAGELQRKNISNFFNSSRKIITNGFVGELEIDRPITCAEVRTELLKNDDSNLIVIRLDADFSSAWRLSNEANEYLTSIFNYIHNDTK